MANNDTRSSISRQPEKRHRSIFDVPSDFFDSCRLLPPRSSSSSSSSFSEPVESYVTASSSTIETLGEDSQDGSTSKNSGLSRWSCNTCKAEFESLQDQRSHFKSDVHRFNVKLSIAGKNIVKEEDFDELSSESLCKDYDVSSISGSEDETDKRSCNDVHLVENAKQKLVIHLRTGERVSVWKCLFLDDFEKILYDLDKSVVENECLPYLRESEVIGKLKYLIHEPRDNTKLRVVLLASGGHFAGCVFDGNLVVAHKTFHRYVVRAKSGKKQSSKDGTGKSANSAGASLRRYNELALKKEIQEIFADWKTYFDVSCCVFIYAPSSNRQLLFNGEKPYFSAAHSVIRNVPFSVRRPTLKEARRIYNQLMQVNYEVDQREFQPNIKEDSLPDASTLLGRDSATSKVNSADNLQIRETTETSASYDKSDDLTTSREREIEVVCAPTPLHEASKSGDAHRVLELLENGLDPCAKDQRGRTPYMLATDKEVRDTFRRFMGINLDKWDWVAAKVPSALTKEMEDSQAAKQAEKDAKRKARAKELKKLRKAREKKAQAEAALSKNTGTSLENRVNGLSVASTGEAGISKEEKLRRAQAEEREKRAAAAERRMAAAALSRTATTNSGSNGSQQPKSGMGTHDSCSCCHDSLEGKVPFHRYNYKYCSTTCMHLHREILEAA